MPVLVAIGDFGLASGEQAGGRYERMWFQDLMAPDEVAFESGVFLLRKATAEAQQDGRPVGPAAVPEPVLEPPPTPPAKPTNAGPTTDPTASMRTLRLTGSVPPEVWNRLGTKVLPKLRSGSDLRIGVDFSVTLSAEAASGLATELRQVLQELGLSESVRVE